MKTFWHFLVPELRIDATFAKAWCQLSIQYLSTTITLNLHYFTTFTDWIYCWQYLQINISTYLGRQIGDNNRDRQPSTPMQTLIRTASTSGSLSISVNHPDTTTRQIHSWFWLSFSKCTYYNNNKYTYTTYTAWVQIDEFCRNLLRTVNQGGASNQIWEGLLR